MSAVQDLRRARRDFRRMQVEIAVLSFVAGFFSCILVTSWLL